jgi:hypothetical protein
MCENLDDNVGRVLKALDDYRLADDTMVLFFCDNGPNGARWNGGMKGRKGSTDEGGTRSPLLIRLPGVIKPGTVVKPIAAAIDILPTLCDLASVKNIGTTKLDGISFGPHLRGGEEATTKRMLFQMWNGRLSVRTQTHRLDADGKLFDMLADPGQQTDISAKQMDLARNLIERAKQAKADWRIDEKENRPFPVGYRQFPITTLPARDGTPHGTVRRSANAPNCSYFTNWTKTTDRLEWNVEIATAGRYRVEVLHTCAKENVGATIAFSLGKANLTKKCTEPHDPKAYGHENDRVPRVGESYVKDFRPWSMGDVALEKGLQTLSLSAIEIPGPQAIEVRAVVLTLLD